MLLTIKQIWNNIICLHNKLIFYIINNKYYFYMASAFIMNNHNNNNISCKKCQLFYYKD